MKQSLVRRIIILLTGILITSVLFFGIAAFSYQSQSRQYIFSSNDSYANTWTSSVDSRLNAIYEHIYDLAVTIYNNTPVFSGSPAMDYQTTRKVQDALSAKIMTSSDITVIFVLDSESDQYMYYSSSTLSLVTNTNLKIYLKQYCLENASSLNNHEWGFVSILQHGYAYKAVRLGKFIIGSVIDCNNLKPDNNLAAGSYGCFVQNEGELLFCSGNAQMSSAVNVTRYDNYIAEEHAVSVLSLKNSKAHTVFVTKQEGIVRSGQQMMMFLIADSGLCVAMILILISYMNRGIRKPAEQLAEANRKLSDGDFSYRLDENQAGSSEFATLYESFNEMSERIDNLTIESYENKLKKEENRLKMLRAQMRPHTFLNGITTISNLTYTGKPEEIREYIAAFARFTRYMLNKSNDWTTIGDELKNIDSYVLMQKIRFPDSIEITYDCPEEIQSVQIPYLILFSLVENSFKHAMTLVETMHLSIKAEHYEEEGFRGIRIIEEDNGEGFSREALEKLLKAEEDDPFTKEHLGLTNVRYSLNLIYRRDDLLRISNREGKGAHVELLIPERENEDETAGM